MDKESNIMTTVSMREALIHVIADLVAREEYLYNALYECLNECAHSGDHINEVSGVEYPWAANGFEKLEAYQKVTGKTHKEK